MLVAGVLIFIVLGALVMWAKASDVGFAFLMMLAIGVTAFTLIHRWRTGRWWDETR